MFHRLLKMKQFKQVTKNPNVDLLATPTVGQFVEPRSMRDAGGLRELFRIAISKENKCI